VIIDIFAAAILNFFAAATNFFEIDIEIYKSVYYYRSNHANLVIRYRDFKINIIFEKIGRRDIALLEELILLNG
jgi:hypothetical protein